MRTKTLNPFRACANLFIPLLCIATNAGSAATPSAKIKTVNEAASIARSLYSEASNGKFGSSSSWDGEFEAPCDFPPFARKGQRCWEVDIHDVHAMPRVVKGESGYEWVAKTIAARIWVNAESGEALCVAGDGANMQTGSSPTDTPLHISRVNAVRQKLFALHAAQIGTNRITDVAVALFEKCFSLKLPKNKIAHMKNMALDFDMDGFAARMETFREIRFYGNNGEKPFVFTGNFAFPGDASDDTRKFLQNKGNLLGTVWAKKHGNEVRFYFPMPDPEPAPQHAGKPSAKPDTNPDAQKPAAQKPSAQRPATAAPSAQKR